MTSPPVDPAAGYLNQALDALTDTRSNMDAHSLDYQARDWDIVDYKMFDLAELPGIKVRGPAFDPHGTDRYFTVMGAAQAFGAYVPRSFADILAEELKLNALNLALGTAGPRFYSSRPQLLALAARGRFLVLQVMSARAEPNSRFEAVGTIEMLRDARNGDIVNAVQAWNRIITEEPAKARQYVAESRASWVNNCLKIIKSVTVPVVCLWISNRRKGDPVDYQARSPGEFMGGFPQIVDDAAVAQVATRCAAFAECGFDRNAGHKLFSRFTGLPTEVDFGKLVGQPGGRKEAVNIYYPSAEQHEDTAVALLKAIATLGASCI